MSSAARPKSARARARTIPVLVLLVAALIGSLTALPTSPLVFARPAAAQEVPPELQEPNLSPVDQAGVATGVCPQNAPLKAASSEEGERFFYVPSDLLYEAISPERCFPSEGAAAAAGYRMHAR